MQSLLHLRIIEVSVYVMDAARVISWYLHSLVEKKNISESKYSR
jgi:hypothetical protein